MRGLMHLGGLILACAGCALATTPAAAQGSYSQFDESATAALARYVRNLAADPTDFTSLIGAGRAALVLGDAEAAAGFFARADAVNPNSPLPQAGMGGVSVLKDNPQAALPYFERAVQLGATLATIGCDRGLAYDLLGDQGKAQADYRAAMNGPDHEEARRRLALSLAISGNRAAALAMLSPLMAKRDPGAERARAFVLALDGNPAGALAAINAAMPGSSDRLAPFLQRLSSLSPGQKAAAINLGIFPDSTAYAYSAPATATPAVAAASNPTADRLASIDAMLNSAPPPARQQAPAQPVQRQWAPAQAVQVSYAPPSVPASVRQRPTRSERQVWLQLASGTPEGLSAKYRRLKGQDRDLFSGITPYLASNGNEALLLIGPFRGASDADFFAEDLETLGVHSSKYINSQTDRIAPLAAE
jgi:tetratricopeptide (TPR) repeat protein